MKVIGNIDILGFASGAFKEYPDFPQNPKVGTWAVIHGSVMACMEIASSPVWLPLTQARNTHIHKQDTASATWNLHHKLGSENVLVQCFDENNNVIIPSEIRTVDEDVTEVVMPDIISGKAIVMYGQESGVSATGKITGGSGGFGVGHLTEFPNRDCITNGYVPLDGQRIFRSVYPEFVDIFGKDLEYVDLPDANGARLFFRGGADAENPFGQIQGDAIRDLTGSFGIPKRHDGGSYNDHADGVFAKGEDATGSSAEKTNESGSTIIEFKASNQVPTADENRPVNTSVVKCIKAFGGQVNEGSVDVQSLLERVNEIENKFNFAAIQDGWDIETNLSFPIGFPIVAWAGAVSNWKIGDTTKVYINSSNTYLYSCDTYGSYNSGKYLDGVWAFTGYVGASNGVETAQLVRVK